MVDKEDKMRTSEEEETEKMVMISIFIFGYFNLNLILISFVSIFATSSIHNCPFEGEGDGADCQGERGPGWEEGGGGQGAGFIQILIAICICSNCYCLFVQFSHCICANFKVYLYNLPIVFVQIAEGEKQVFSLNSSFCFVCPQAAGFYPV